MFFFAQKGFQWLAHNRLGHGPSQSRSMLEERAERVDSYPAQNVIVRGADFN